MKVNFLKSTLKFAAIALVASLTLVACDKDDEEDEPIVLDGLYVKGAVAPASTFDTKSRMAVAKNEVTQENRASLYEIYLPLKAGAAGFSIVQVAGATRTTWSPSDFTTITEGTTDEPKADFQRGDIEAGTAVFTVPADGFYHIALDTELKRMVIIPVTWGLIGGATPNGWGGSTAMTPSAFTLTSITWTLNNFELRGGEWKFRHSDGWKAELDTVLAVAEGKKGVKINTNFGGAINALVPGGGNINNTAPGVYNASLAWTYGSGYVATMTKTADLPLTNWTGVMLDIVGEGVSIDNPNATDDVSSWNWGNRLLADNGAVPTKVGDKYTWTWTNVVLEADKGFKVRTKDGVAPASGGANFDVGFSAVVVASSSNKVIDLSGNLGVNAKGTFTITIVVDAADSDSKKITITQ